MPTIRHHSLTAALLFALLCSLLPGAVNAQPVGPNSAPSAADAALTVQATAAGVDLSWALSPDQSNQIEVAGMAAIDWPTVAYQGYELPMRLVSVQVTGDAAAQSGELVRVRELETAPWSGSLQLATAPTPPELPADEMPEFVQPRAEDPRLPTAPVFVLREGRMRGHTVRVLAISPIFAQDGSPRLATRFSAEMLGVTPLTDGLQSLAAAPAELARTDAIDVTPPNKAATVNGVRIRVSETGIQIVTGQALAAVGVTVSDVTKLGVSFKGQPVAVEVRDNNNNGVLDSNESIRFFAEPGDNYWNNGEIYWLTTNGEMVARMGLRSVVPDGTSQQRSTAYETGVWRDYPRSTNGTNSGEVLREYTTLYPGPNGDHWFAAKMQTSTNGTQQSVPMRVASRLPVDSSGETEITVKALIYKLDPNIGQGVSKPPKVTLKVAMGDSSDKLTFITDNQLFEGDAADRIATAELNSEADDVQIILLPPEAGIIGDEVVETSAQVYLDEVEWRRHVQLNFLNAGAIFSGADETWIYSMRRLPEDYRLYEITNPLETARLTGMEDVNGFIKFQDGPTAKRYLVSGPGTEHQPVLEAHAGKNVAADLGNIDAFYIAPASFHSTLQPLVEHRRTQQCWQGMDMSKTRQCKIAVIDLDEIYDGYGYGYVDPLAIRNFLQAVYQGYGGELEAATLVGDGSQDPKNYEGRAYDAGIDPAIIPPYMAYQIGEGESSVYVDLFIRRTGCENCFAQLDGANPLDGDDPDGSEGPPVRPGSGFLPDIMFGRMPVKNAVELRDMVSKIVAYEKDYDPDDHFNEKFVFLSDNYVKSCDPNGKRDTAGDFVFYTESVIDRIPDSVEVNRIFYDPPQIYDPTDLDNDGTICNFVTSDSGNGSFEGNPWTAYNKVLTTLNRGAAMLTYNGHSSQWRYAVTEREQSAQSALPPGAPEHLFYIFDVDSLNNRDHPFVALSMTCLTSQFHKPIEFGMTLDEHMVTHNKGGAVVTWGSSGLSVAQGHDLLQTGFHEELWRETDTRRRMGELVMGGYLKQFTESGCCDDVRRTFMILGDPLTHVRIGMINDIYLPTVRR